VRRLIPDPCADVTVAEALDGYRPWDDPPEDRPRVLSNFVLSLDGRATIEGRSGPIGSDTDTAMLVALRTRVDAVMIGAGTLRAERYGRVVGDPAKRERREEAGLTPDPLMVIVGGAELPWDAGLFTSGAGEVLILTASDEEPPETATPVRMVRHEGEVHLPTALNGLRAEHGIRALLCEGGPRLHARLIEADLVDELFITRAPKVVGGEGPGLVTGLAESDRQLQLEWLLAEAETGELFGRYSLS
jgi:riboflavin biosynthesis pyrimidine reductase